MANHPNSDVVRARQVCCGNEEAVQFLLLWSEYAHGIDDIVDMDRTDTEFVIATFGLANRLYSHPFYLAHYRELGLVVQLVTNAYADAEAMKASQYEWKRQTSDVLRHAGAEMLRAVVYLCGGYEHLRGLSERFHEVAYYEHHDAEGKPV
jgi:hypothetical protein